MHCDFKPGNILVDRQGVVRVSDFGLARATRSHAAIASASMIQVSGTPAYMAPEQFDGVATAATDQFSYCVALWEVGGLAVAAITAFVVTRESGPTAPVAPGAPVAPVAWSGADVANQHVLTTGGCDDSPRIARRTRTPSSSATVSDGRGAGDDYDLPGAVPDQRHRPVVEM